MTVNYQCLFRPQVAKRTLYSYCFANPGITDASNLVQNKPADFPFIVAGPGNLTSHKVNEELDKQMYFNFIDLYENLTINCLDKLTVKVQSL